MVARHPGVYAVHPPPLSVRAIGSPVQLSAKQRGWSSLGLMV